ncbi:serine protease [Flagelloscypha sp. PMI_526]|nr:serine protease [Flagelloscypha sp. PMI_526]
MHFATSFTTLALLASAIFAAPAPTHKQVKRAEATLTGRMIVTLKDGADRSAVMSDVGLVSAAIDDWEVINAFVIENDEAIVDALLAHDDVLEIEEDGIATILVTQTNAPWGLARLSSTSPVTGSASSLTFSYTYQDPAGSGSDVYVVDTGIRTTHSQFGGRAKWGTTFGGYANADGNGHGTHCAGTIAGSQFGVSKAVSVIAVKVLSDAGSGSFSDVISGINYVAAQKAATGRPTVLSMSLGGSASTAVDSAVASATAAGVHVVVAAGNSNTDAGSTSPARAPSAVTVGATTITDARASFSNYGSVVDIWAPGQDIISAYGTSDTATASLSGTSMATPHVAGLIAYLISVTGEKTPAAMTAYLQSLCLKNVVSGIPSGTINCIAHNV